MSNPHHTGQGSGVPPRPRNPGAAPGGPTYGMRVEIDRPIGEPATCKVWRGLVLVFDGVEWSALLKAREVDGS